MKINRGNTAIADVWAGAASYTLEEINGARIAYVEFATLTPVELTVGDAITYEGETYYLRHREDVTKEEVSRGYSYRVKFYHDMYRLHDVVAFPYEQPDFRKNMNKYNGTARQVLEIVVRSMNRVYPGWSIADCEETKTETFDLKDKKCAEVVNDLISRYDSEVYVQGRAITFGKRHKAGTGHVYSQGEGGGFRAITLSAVEEVPPLTRLYAYGSDKNMAAQGTKDALDYLPLPGGVKCLEKNTDKYGIIEDVKPFPEIYPHGVFTVTERVDEFTLQASSIDFDLEAQLIDGTEPVVTFQDGGLAGYDLNIVKGSWSNATKQFKLAKVEEEGALKVPGDIHFAVGDKFILTGIRMPQSYIDKAAEELKAAAQKFLDSKCENRTKLAVTCDEVYFAAHGLTVQCGEMIHVKDERLGLDREIRTTSVKRFIENDEPPYRYELVLSDFLDGNRFVQDMRELKKESKEAKERAEEMVRYSRRQWADVKETQEQLKKDFADKFGESINPVTIETMQMIVGHEQLQFVFVDSRTEPQKAVSVYPEFIGGRIRIQAGGRFLKHMTMGIKSVTSKRNPSQYRYWAMPDFTSEALASDKTYRLFARVEASGSNGTFVLYDSFKDMNAEAGYYLLFMGYIGAEREGNRSWGRAYGFTEILPGQITTELIQDPNAQLVIDLTAGRITGQLTITAGSVGYNNLTDKPDLTGYLTKSEFKVTADQIRAEVGRANTTAGATKAQLDAFQQQTQRDVTDLIRKQNIANENIYHLQTAGFITTAQGNALYASAQLANGKTIASYIVQNPEGIDMIAKNINLYGNTTFSNSMGNINARINQTNEALKSKVNSNSLGSLAWKNKVGTAMMDETIISGGYINTSLINTKAIKISDGTELGGFWIDGDNISSKGFKTASPSSQMLAQGVISLSPRGGLTVKQYYPGGSSKRSEISHGEIVVDNVGTTTISGGTINTMILNVYGRSGGSCSIDFQNVGGLARTKITASNMIYKGHLGYGKLRPVYYHDNAQCLCVGD